MLWAIVAVIIIVGGGFYFYSAQRGSDNGVPAETTQNDEPQSGAPATENPQGTAAPASGNPDEVVNDIINQAAGDAAEGEAGDTETVAADVESVTNIGNAYDANQF